jgi:hypothetical protein
MQTFVHMHFFIVGDDISIYVPIMLGYSIYHHLCVGKNKKKLLVIIDNHFQKKKQAPYFVAYISR